MGKDSQIFIPITHFHKHIHSPHPSLYKLDCLSLLVCFVASFLFNFLPTMLMESMGATPKISCLKYKGNVILFLKGFSFLILFNFLQCYQYVNHHSFQKDQQMQSQDRCIQNLSRLFVKTTKRTFQKHLCESYVSKSP